MKRTEPISETPDNQLEKIAAESGLAVVVVDDRASVAKANNNSICEILYASKEFAPRCANDCGRAFQMAAEADAPVSYECHAGLHCLAVRLKTAKPLVAIVGRTFTKAENYRRATERAISGAWSKFPPTRFFENVLITGSSKALEKTAKAVVGLGDAVLEAERARSGDGEIVEPQITNDERRPTNEEQPTTDDVQRTSAVEQPAASDELTKRIAEFHRRQPAQIAVASEKSVQKTMADADDSAAWRSLFGSLFDLTYHDACAALLKFLSHAFALRSLAWLERRENHFESLLATGALAGQQFRINLPANDRSLFDALEKEFALDLRERARGGETKAAQTISLFPVAVGTEIQCAVVVADKLPDEAVKRRIARFCKTIAAQLEILRLREEVKRRSWLAEAVEKFNASLNNLDNDDFWSNLTRVSAELLQAERSSLLIFDEKKNSLTVKAAIGATAERITNKSEKIGERVARIVLHNGKPVVVNDIAELGFPSAPADWKYKTNSFISYPIIIGGRRVGILNVTDKADGEPYGESDLELLDAIAPQFAVLIDRADLKSRAGRLEQLSVTDELTGLLNRRYLEQRLAEEIKRSNRYGYPMSFMMIDVDHFKSYNDAFGHTAGDNALKLVARCFRETLRSADIAARYGGEEFSILLPQTSSTEAASIAERLREHIQTTKFPHRAITVSIGIASCCLELNTPRELIVAADSALYEAKRKGRNSVRIYENIRKNQTDDTPDQKENQS